MHIFFIISIYVYVKLSAAYACLCVRVCAHLFIAIVCVCRLDVRPHCARLSQHEWRSSILPTLKLVEIEPFIVTCFSPYLFHRLFFCLKFDFLLLAAIQCDTVSHCVYFALTCWMITFWLHACMYCTVLATVRLPIEKRIK